MEATKQHCFLCFSAATAHIKRDSPPRTSEQSNENIPLFVTWKLTANGKLRGCIGSLNPVAFPEGLCTYAIKSAFQDRRFSPMTLEDISNSTVSVSLLVNFESGLKWDEWDIGLHGIILTFFIKEKRFSAVFLPEVALEQKWTKWETVQALINKSGYVGKEPIDKSKLSIERFTSSKCHATFKEWNDGL
jgi:uncharacterized protein (TIGR00296 family)